MHTAIVYVPWPYHFMMLSNKMSQVELVWYLAKRTPRRPQLLWEVMLAIHSMAFFFEQATQCNKRGNCLQIFIHIWGKNWFLRTYSKRFSLATALLIIFCLCKYSQLFNQISFHISSDQAFHVQLGQINKNHAKN